MSIFPIVKGQKPNQRHLIPPHSPTAVVDKQLGHFDDHTTLEKPKPEGVKAQKEQPQDNLIDFDEAPASQPAQPAQPAKQNAIKPTPSEVEIENMLNSTGKAADGPLIDFVADLKKDLPVDTKQ